MIPQMAAVGLALNPPVSFDFGGRIYPTGAAHVAIEAAFGEGGAKLQDAMVEALFHHFFESKGDLTPEEVGRVAKGVGLTTVTPAQLATQSKAIEAEVSHWRNQYDVSGVPFFVIRGGENNSVLQTLSGAVDPKLIADAIAKVARV